MALNQQIRQKQAQSATPVMMMGFSLLQLPASELREAVKKEVESNPALEVDTPAYRGGVRGAASVGDKEGFLENVADERGETLDEHLLGELRMSGVTGRDLALARAIIENLDGDGRFIGSYADLVMILEGEGVGRVTERELEAARERVMKTDPKGCGARDLAECYRVQLDAIPAAKRPAAERAVGELEAAIRENRLSSFRPSDLKAFLLLKALDPYPGRLFDRVKTAYVTPDVIVDARGEVHVDQGDVPDLRVSQKYIEMAKDRELDEETRAYAAERVKRAREFREALIRRKETIEAVAEETIDSQRGYFAEGPAGIRRLTMSEVAKRVNCTVSTVSRAAARKYVKSSRGVVPLRKFFALVDQAPVEKLREIIASVPRGTHVSDRELAERLEKAGYSLARRTVAKYRKKITG